MTTNAVSVSRLTRVYETYAESVCALEEVSFCVPRGDILAVTGPSGSGKTTLLAVLAGLDRDYSGSVRIGDVVLEDLKDRDVNRWRGDNVGLVFQTHHLLPVLTASQNVELPLLRMALDGRSRAARARAALKLVGLAERAEHLPRDLSGGERQRVALARAIVTNANLILCDEPTGSLNREARDVVLEILQSLAADYGHTIVLVTHDPEAAAIAAHRLSLTNGRMFLEPGALRAAASA